MGEPGDEAVFLAQVMLVGGVGVGIMVGVWARRRLLVAADDGWNDAVWEGMDMIVRGLHKAELYAMTDGVDLTFDNLREANTKGSAWAFKLRPTTATSEYARRAPSGRRGQWTCYHGFAWFIGTAFAVGATSINTVGPRGKRKTYHSWEEFSKDLVAFQNRQLGNMDYPVTYIDLCEHEEG